MAQRYLEGGRVVGGTAVTLDFFLLVNAVHPVDGLANQANDGSWGQRGVEVIEVSSSRMEAPEGKPWMRWQDWVALILGVYTLLATLWTWTSGNALTAMVVLGALLVIAGAWSLSMPSSMTSEYAHILLGVLLFIAPWVLGYSGLMGAAWTSWVVGVLAVIVGAAALPEARSTVGQH